MCADLIAVFSNTVLSSCVAGLLHLNLPIEVDYWRALDISSSTMQIACVFSILYIPGSQYSSIGQTDRIPPYAVYISTHV